MENGELLRAVVAAASEVHSTLGPGFVESIYGKALHAELRGREIPIERERQIKIRYGSFIVGKHNLDLVVDGTVIVELKASRGILPVHAAQVRSYLKASSYPFGVVINFGAAELQWEVFYRNSQQPEPATKK